MAKGKHDAGRGPTQRQLRVGEVIRRVLSEALARGDIHDPDLNRMSITVGEVRTSPDLKTVTAFVLPLGGRNVDEALEALRRNKYELRRLIGKATTLKYTPDIKFEADDIYDRLDETRRLFAQESVRRDLEQDDSTDD